MDVQARFPAVDSVLDAHGEALGGDRAAYGNHVARVLNYVRALSGEDECPPQVVVAAAFHDLGIWTAGTFDYLAPSVRLARDRVEQAELAPFADEIETIILQHHKLTRYTGPFAATVETFRRADLVDVSLGAIRSGVPRRFVRAVKAAFPNAGFHRRLVALTVRQLARDPLHPLPMLRW